VIDVTLGTGIDERGVGRPDGDVACERDRLGTGVLRDEPRGGALAERDGRLLSLRLDPFPEEVRAAVLSSIQSERELVPDSWRTPKRCGAQPRKRPVEALKK